MGEAPTTAVRIQAPPTFLVELRRDLIAELMTEVELTLRVGVMSAAGMSRPQITKALEVDDVETRMAMVRLQRVASSWGL